jgi:hypothetical protein
VNVLEVMPVLLLLLFSVALSIGMGVIVLVIRRARNKTALEPDQATECAFARTCVFLRPSCWVAIKSRSLLAVQSALGLHNPKPCSWVDGVAGDEKLFIAPPMKGWILVMGSGLPEPGDDVDACFRFVLGLSRKLGQVQFFCASRALRHHAWVKADGGRVVRAYAWAGKTLWQQGARTAAEKELGLRCFDYFQAADPAVFGQSDALSLNTEKVPLLAARWSLDPGHIEERFLEAGCGIAGELWRRY